MNPRLQAGIDLLKNHDLEFDLDEARQVLLAELGLRNVRTRLVYLAEDDETAVIHAQILPVSVPADRRAAVAEFLLRINRNLNLGAFELDFDDGEVRHRTVLDFGEEPPPAALLGRILLGTSLVIDGFWPALMSVTYGRTAPATAVEQGEARVRDLLENLHSTEHRRRT